jgi:hypothetical protein
MHTQTTVPGPAWRQLSLYQESALSLELVVRLDGRNGANVVGFTIKSGDSGQWLAAELATSVALDDVADVAAEYLAKGLAEVTGNLSPF